MQEVKTALEQFADAPVVGDDLPPIEIPDFAEVSANWARYCVYNLRGDLLKIGLNISAALAEFDRGLKHPDTLKD